MTKEEQELSEQMLYMAVVKGMYSQEGDRIFSDIITNTTGSLCVDVSEKWPRNREIYLRAKEDADKIRKNIMIPSMLELRLITLEDMQRYNSIEEVNSLRRGENGGCANGA